MDTEVTLRKRRSCPCVNTLCRRGTHWKTGRPKIYITDHNPSWKENQRQKKDSFWIRELQTLHPEGINKKA